MIDGLLLERWVAYLEKLRGSQTHLRAGWAEVVELAKRAGAPQGDGTVSVRGVAELGELVPLLVDHVGYLAAVSHQDLFFAVDNLIAESLPDGPLDPGPSDVEPLMDLVHISRSERRFSDAELTAALGQLEVAGAAWRAVDGVPVDSAGIVLSVFPLLMAHPHIDQYVETAASMRLRIRSSLLG